MSTFAVGEKVTWTSQANGIERTKMGTIIGIVPPNTSLYRYLDGRADCERQHYNRNNLSLGYVRAEQSYLVAVAMVTRTGKPKKRAKLYWPRVGLLQKSEADDKKVEG